MDFKSKVDWWVYAIVVFTIVYCCVTTFFFGDYWAGITLSVVCASLEIVAFTGIKYRLEGDKLGVRSFYRWKWYPVDKISKVKKVKGILSAPALSTSRVAITFSDRKILKSFAPMEISPLDRDGFISALLTVNPEITVG